MLHKKKSKVSRHYYPDYQSYVILLLSQVIFPFDLCLFDSPRGITDSDGSFYTIRFLLSA